MFNWWSLESQIRGGDQIKKDETDSLALLLCHSVLWGLRQTVTHQPPTWGQKMFLLGTDNPK